MHLELIDNFDYERDLAGKTILLVGASGFIGSEIGIHLVRHGCTIRALDNSSPEGDPNIPYPCDYTYWDYTMPIPASVARGVDVIINAAGLSMLTGEWTYEVREEIVNSRVEITYRCADAADQHDIPVMLQMSWTGFYGTTHETLVNEWFPAGRSLTAQWCAAWEAATCRVRTSKTRLVIMRTSPVLAMTGGALMELLNHYMMGLGASLRQKDLYFSWIHIEDFLSFVSHAIVDKSYSGTYNVCMPNPLSYYEGHLELSKYYPSQLVVGASSTVIKLSTGDKAPLFLQSSRIEPRRLLQRGFKFKFPTFAEAFADLLAYKVDSIIHFRTRYYLNTPRRDVYKFVSDPNHWIYFVPPYLNLTVTEITSNPVREGTEVGYKLSYFGIPLNWREKVLNCDPGHTFQVIQLYGPFDFYEMTRTFTDLGHGTLYDTWHRYRASYGHIFKTLAYLNIKRTQVQIRKHERRVLKEWFGSNEANAVGKAKPNAEDNPETKDLEERSERKRRKAS